MTNSDVRQVLGLERELQTAECRRDPALLTLLLAEDMIEVGASGATWDRAAILAMLAEELPHRIEVSGLTGRVVGDGLILTLWESRSGPRRAKRSSLWRLGPEGWQLVFHQGTPLT